MSVTPEPGCFVCDPTGLIQGGEVPFDWSQPRSLCRDHNRDLGLQLEDGQSLEAVLGRAEPPDFPLEGSLLAWIYNPAFIGLGPRSGTKAWLDFVGGGMMVLEDRFSSDGYFEFIALEQPRAVTFLYLVRLAADGGDPVSSMSDVFRLLAQASQDPRLSPHLQAASDGLDRLSGVWNFREQLARRRSSAGRLWPESHLELQAWMEECRPTLDGSPIEPHTEARFFGALHPLATRRFPVLP